VEPALREHVPASEIVGILKEHKNTEAVRWLGRTFEKHAVPDGVLYATLAMCMHELGTTLPHAYAEVTKTFETERKFYDANLYETYDHLRKAKEKAQKERNDKVKALMKDYAKRPRPDSSK
jgi:hypothetical protein